MDDNLIQKRDSTNTPKIETERNLIHQNRGKGETLGDKDAKNLRIIEFEVIRQMREVYLI